MKRKVTVIALALAVALVLLPATVFTAGAGTQQPAAAPWSGVWGDSAGVGYQTMAFWQDGDTVTGSYTYNIIDGPRYYYTVSGTISGNTLKGAGKLISTGGGTWAGMPEAYTMDLTISADGKSITANQGDSFPGQYIKTADYAALSADSSPGGAFSWSGVWCDNGIDQQDPQRSVFIAQNGGAAFGYEDYMGYFTGEVSGNVLTISYSDGDIGIQYVMMTMSADGKSYDSVTVYKDGTTFDGGGVRLSPVTNAQGDLVPPQTPEPTPVQSGPYPAAPTPWPSGTLLYPDNGPVLTAQAIGGDGDAMAAIRLTWTDFDDPGVQYYRLYRSTGSYGEQMIGYNIFGDSFMDVQIDSGADYYYIVTPAIALDGGTVFRNSSNIAEVTTGQTCASLFGGNIRYILMTVGSGTMTLDGAPWDIDPGHSTAPVIIDGRAMAPIRTIVGAMGGAVDWDADARQVTITYGGNTVIMTIGSADYTVNGAAQSMDAVPVINGDGRTLLPLRFVADALGCQVDWLEQTKEIMITFGMGE
ncbi:MAG: copper amine oxidase N-terminal domain-containing protein [Defluviitaleaceae bacterium]|nr:copper amine oxidase N-terminal domain-containing protein [Defluviitaleaceae bacterium]